MQDKIDQLNQQRQSISRMRAMYNMVESDDVRSDLNVSIEAYEDSLNYSLKAYPGSMFARTKLAILLMRVDSTLFTKIMSYVCHADITFEDKMLEWMFLFSDDDCIIIQIANTYVEINAQGDISTAFKDFCVKHWCVEFSENIIMMFGAEPDTWV